MSVFNGCFDDKVLYLRRKIKRELVLEKTKKRFFTVVYYNVKLNYLPSNYQFPSKTCSKLIMNWLLCSIFPCEPPLWTFIYKKINYINNGKIMWNMMKFFMSKVKRVYIEKIYW